MNLFFLTAEMVILINHKVILEHSADEQADVKDHTLLDSALKRPLCWNHTRKNMRFIMPINARRLCDVHRCLFSLQRLPPAFFISSS